MFKQILRKTNLPHGSDHRWALNRSIIGFEPSWNHKRLTKTFPRRELTCFTKQTLGMYPLGEHLSWLEFHMHSFWMFKRVSTILKSWEAHEDVLQERIEFRGGGSVLKNQFQGGGVCIEKSIRGGGVELNDQLLDPDSPTLASQVKLKVSPKGLPFVIRLVRSDGPEVWCIATPVYD